MNTPEQYLTTPHSFGDWDYYKVVDWTDFYLHEKDEYFYVSPSSSLVLGNTLFEVYALSKLPQAMNLTAGRISCWVRHLDPGPGNPYFYIGVTGKGSIGIRLIPFMEKWVWHRTRFTWWQGYNLNCLPCTWIVREKWDGSNWIEPMAWDKDPMTGHINRVGIGSTPQSIGYARSYDDTIIEKITNLPETL